MRRYRFSIEEDCSASETVECAITYRDTQLSSKKFLEIHLYRWDSTWKSIDQFLAEATSSYNEEPVKITTKTHHQVKIVINSF